MHIVSTVGNVDEMLLIVFVSTEAFSASVLLTTRLVFLDRHLAFHSVYHTPSSPPEKKALLLPFLTVCQQEGGLYGPDSNHTVCV